MEILKKIGDALSNIHDKIENAQEKFVESNFGKIISNALDVGIRVALPDFAENAVIDMKNALYENGIKDGIKQIWTNMKDYGKAFLGVSTGKFETIEQIQKATNTGGILDTISSAFDFALEKCVDSGKITKKARQSIKTQKNNMLKKMKNEILDETENQAGYAEKIQSYQEKWEECFENKDLKGMQNANKNIQKYLEKTFPLESILKQARKTEMIQKLVENTGSFDITDEEKELANMLA